MTDTYQHRFIALQTAALLLGSIPKGSDLEQDATFLDYLTLSDKIDLFLRRGGTINNPNPPKETSSSVQEAKTLWG